MSDHVSVEHMAGPLSHCLPGLQNIEPLKFVGEGFHSIAVETADGVLIRVGKLEEAARGFALETKVLPLVKRLVNAPVPEPELHIEPCTDFPFGALGYRKLPGRIPTPGDQSLSRFFIPELASFLVSLHAIPVDEVRSVGVPQVDAPRRMLGAKPVVMPMLAGRLSRDQYRLLESWWSDVESETGTADYEISVCHHDLWHENLLVDENRHLSGVLDWSHIEIGDPAQSFAAIYHFGPRLVEQFFDEYRAAGGELTDNDLRRIRRYWEGRHLGGLAWAIENDVKKEIEDGVEKLKTGPLLG